MRWRGIILTGTSAAGKSSISQRLRQREPAFEQVKAVTTRPPRADDAPELYDYLTSDEFGRLGESLMVRAVYREQFYGITHRHIVEVESRRKAPLLLLTPLSLAEYVLRIKAQHAFLSVFVDAPDEVLDARIASRAGVRDWAPIHQQRAEDRVVRGAANHVLSNVDLDVSLQQLLGWWREEPNSQES